MTARDQWWEVFGLGVVAVLFILLWGLRFRFTKTDIARRWIGDAMLALGGVAAFICAMLLD